MISVDEALETLFALVTPLSDETVPLRAAAGRVLARDVTATRLQPPFAASAMDGYAVRAEGLAPGARYRVIGEAAAGRRYDGGVGAHEAVRIFTGAPVPDGAERVVIQEDVTREGREIVICDGLGPGSNIRPAGADFGPGTPVRGPRRLSPRDIALLAAMNITQVPVVRRPEIALIATGDELVPPGTVPGDDQIIASNSYGLAAMLRELGATCRMLPIARDNRSALRAVLDLARGADLVLTIGGASVGDHDLVSAVVHEMGLAPGFHKVAMRPGKPLMAGRLGESVLVGLPGNPVSAMVCGEVFVRPMVTAMLRLGAAPAPRRRAMVTEDLRANGPREHYMRAHVCDGQITPAPRQDSALLTVLAEANALLIRPPHDPARPEGTEVEFIEFS